MDHLLKTKKEFKDTNKTGDAGYIYQNELEKACFQHDKAYGDFKDLPRRIASYQVLRNKAFNIPKNPKYDGYQRGFTPMVYKFFDKWASGGAGKKWNYAKQTSFRLSSRG